MEPKGLVFECECGARLGYKPEWGGRSGTCRKCGARFTLPKNRKNSAEESVEEAGYGVAAAEIKPPKISFESVPEPKSEASIKKNVRGATAGDRGFWADAFRGFMFWNDAENAIRVGLLILFVTGVMIALPFMACFGLFVIIGMYGYLAGYCFRTIVHAASEDDELPDPFAIGGFYEGILAPLVTVLAVSLALALPGIAVGLLTQNPTAQLVTGAIGYFLWPAVMLIAAIGGAGSAFRLDIAVRTIASAFFPYLAIWIMLLVGIGGEILAGTAAFAGLTVPILKSGHPLLLLLLFNVVGVSMLVISMRTIGLYYRHFKDRFPWSAG